MLFFSDCVSFVEVAEEVLRHIPNIYWINFEVLVRNKEARESRSDQVLVNLVLELAEELFVQGRDLKVQVVHILLLIIILLLLPLNRFKLLNFLRSQLPGLLEFKES